MNEHDSERIAAVLTADGMARTEDVEQADVVESSGSPRLDRAARDRVLTWHFHPALQAGQPVPSSIEQTITFKLTL